MTFNDSPKARHELASALLDLISAERWTRRAAAERLPVDTTAGRQALRRALFHDPQAAVRAAAASRLGRSVEGTSAVAGWLCDALDDATPLVREAALRALCRLCERSADEHFTPPPDAAARCERLGLEDPVWWVRRAAVVALYALRGTAALPSLRLVLADPFWRVRHTAVQALSAIGDATPALRPQILRVTPELPSLVQSSLWYLHARWQPEVEVHAFAAPPAPDDEAALANPDPAVMTARLRARPPESVDPLELVPLLADPHLPLRQLAAARLRSRLHLGSLRAALRYLETPAPPHAYETVNALLSRLFDVSRVLCAEILRSENPPRGALVWASHFAAENGDTELLPELLQKLRTLPLHPQARIAVLQALCALSESAAEEAAAQAELLRALADGDLDVRSAAAMELARFANAEHPQVDDKDRSRKQHERKDV